MKTSTYYYAYEDFSNQKVEFSDNTYLSHCLLNNAVVEIDGNLFLDNMTIVSSRFFGETPGRAIVSSALPIEDSVIFFRCSFNNTEIKPLLGFTFQECELSASDSYSDGYKAA